MAIQTWLGMMKSVTDVLHPAQPGAKTASAAGRRSLPYHTAGDKIE